MMEYRSYIGSPEWASRKERFFKKHPRCCSRCSSEQSVHLHHLTYARLGKEKDDDLMPLCASCHHQLHKQHRRTRVPLDEFSLSFVQDRGRPHAPTTESAPSPSWQPEYDYWRWIYSQAASQQPSPERTLVLRVASEQMRAVREQGFISSRTGTPFLQLRRC